MSRKYASKIMLFGEYGILCGGEALAIPYPKYQTWWSDTAENDGYEIPENVMQGLLQYCREQSFLQGRLQFEAWEAALQAGKKLFTTIRPGYGLGSSGAVVAAVYDHFKEEETTSMADLKEILARIEDYFHLKSSGLDPLVSLLNSGIYVHAGGLEAVEVPNTLSFSLYDTEVSRSTAHLVTIFKERMKDTEYAGMVERIYLPLVADSIQHWLQGKKEVLLQNLHRLSAFQLEFFNFAIPKHSWVDWNKDLQDSEHLMKLCGAGGGGYLLRFDTL